MKGLLILLSILLVACSSLSKQECEKMDWATQGQQDGASGVPSSQVQAYQDQCQYHGLFIDKPGYLTGHQKGLRSFCSFENGKKAGLNGEDPFHDCDKVTNDFRRGFDQGFRVYNADKVKKENEERREEIMRKAEEDLVMGKMKCSSNSDCDRTGVCTFGKCEHNDKECISSFDCQIEGECTTISQSILEFGETVEAQVCREY